MYRVVTSGVSFRTGKPTHRTEFLVMDYAVAARISDANDVARYRFERGNEPDYFVLAEWLDMETGEWVPIDGQFFTAQLTSETKARWDARHGIQQPERGC